MSHLNIFKNFILAILVLVFAISCSKDNADRNSIVVDEETTTENTITEETGEDENTEEEEEVVEEEEEIIEGPQDDPYDESAFIITWEAAYDQDYIWIRTNPEVDTPYNFTVNWGDGTIDTGLSENTIHEYAKEGVYTVQITGDFPAIYNDSPYANTKLLTVENWGDIKWESMNRAFQNCTNIVFNATDVPDLSRVTDMYFMFYGAHIFNSDLSAWNVSNVTDMDSMFFNAEVFNQDISEWDVSKVTNMENMFNDALLFSQNLSGWATENVTECNSFWSDSSLEESQLPTAGTCFGG
mgnify:CR=1 FL=1